MTNALKAALISLLLPFLTVTAMAASDYLSLRTPSDWNELFKLCENNWPKYEADLVRLRNVLKREIDSMSEQTYQSLYKKGDAKIRFVRMHWPSDFSMKDPGWEMYRDCSELNWEVRKLLSSSGSEASSKKRAVDAFESCVRKTFYGPKGKIGHPFDRLLACYRKH